MFNNLFPLEDLPLIQFSHTFAAASIWHGEGMQNQIATFDLVIRDMPQNRNYLVFGGLEETLYYLKRMKFRQEDISFLLKAKLITKEFAKYLKTFKFSGDIYSLPEGTIFFSGEPVIRVTAPIIEAALLEVFFFTLLSSNVSYLSKAARLRIVADDAGISISIGSQRAPSFESSIKILRAGYICGAESYVNPILTKKYKFPIPKFTINAQHLYVKSFPDELTAFEKHIKYFPGNSSFMIDTYNIKKGVKNAITIAKELEKKRKKLCSVCIDGGDLLSLSKYVRKELDKNNLEYVDLLIASNLDEYKIKDLMKKGAPKGIYVVATEFSTLYDSPKLEVVYKLAQLKKGNKIINTAKLTPGKESYPGKKQVYRVFKNKTMQFDVIGLEGERLGTPMLKKFMSQGKIMKNFPTLKEIKEYFSGQIKLLPEKLKDLEKDQTYTVKISPKLKKLFQKVKETHQ